VALANGVDANLVFKWIRRSWKGWPDRRCGAGDGASAATSSSREASETPEVVPIRLVAEQGVPTLTTAELEGAPVCGTTRRARRGSGRWRFAFPPARKFGSKKASTTMFCVCAFRR